MSKKIAIAGMGFLGIKAVSIGKLGNKEVGKILTAESDPIYYPKPKFESFNFTPSDFNPEVLKTLFGDPDKKVERMYKITSKNGNSIVFQTDSAPTIQRKKFKLFRGKQYARPFIYFEWVDIPEGNIHDLILNGFGNDRRINIIAKK